MNRGSEPDPQEFAWRLAQATPRTRVTLILIAANLAVWLLNLATGVSPIAPRAIELLAWGGNHLPLTREEPWRLVTSAFLHGGIIHLGFNMWVLWDTGRLAERFYGSTQLLLVYGVSAVAGSIASLFFAAGEGVSVGASGAIFGVVGCLLAAVTTKAHRMPRELAASIRGSMLLFIAYAAVMGLAVGFVDNAAHAGGLAAGLLLGAVLAERFDEAEFRRQGLVRALAGLAVAAALLMTAWKLLPSPAA